MPKGGTLTIETAQVELTRSPVYHLTPLPPGPYVRLAVSDTGCGMDRKTQSHIFEPFFTTKGEGKGTGLGLSTVFGIVTQCGGAIDVTSQVGHGTRFDLYFPSVESDILTMRRPSHWDSLREARKRFSWWKMKQAYGRLCETNCGSWATRS